MSKITAVIDIGSNSARMAIFEKTSRYGFHLIYEVKSKVRISEGCYENGGYLQGIPMRRAIMALRDFRLIAKKYAARKLLCVATSAIRDAPNKMEFLRMARKQSGIDIKVIDGAKEAWYGGIACANLSHNKNGITIDIGGGSTECAIIKDGRVYDLISLKLGTIRLKELFFDHHKGLEAAKEFIKNELKKLPKHFVHDNVFGIGGTIRAIAKINSKQTKYPIKTIHGYEILVKECKNFIQMIYKTKEERLEEIGVPVDRRDNIRSGALIFWLLLEHFGAKKITASGVGVREGVFLADMLRGQNFRFPNGIYPSLIALKDRCKAHQKYLKNISKQSLLLFDVLKPAHNLDYTCRFYLNIVSQLCDIGVFLNFYGKNDHGAYFLLHGLDYGFSHTDRAIVCLLVEYINKRIPKDETIVSISDIMPPIQTLQWLSYVISLAYALAVTNESKIRYVYFDKTLQIHTDTPLYLSKELTQNLTSPTKINLEFVN